MEHPESEVPGLKEAIKVLDAHWEKRFFLLSEELEKAKTELMLSDGISEGFRKEADETLLKLRQAEARIHELEQHWLQAAFVFRKQHKAVMGE